MNPKKMKKIKTEAEKVRGYLTHHFRLAWRFYSEKRKECLKTYNCAVCKKAFLKKDLAADHIEPVIDPQVGFVDWNTYAKRMFEGELQALCGECHNRKSAAERKAGAERRAKLRRKIG